MKKIGLLSDTHGYLSKKIFHYFDSVDEIWHAGDVGSLEVYEDLERFKTFRCVWGNIDGTEIRKRCKETETFYIGNLKFLMMHIGGYPPKYNKTSLPLIEKERPDVFISGHSHILKIMPDEKRNILHLNPGACGNQGWHKMKTVITFEIDHDRLKNLTVIEINE